MSEEYKLNPPHRPPTERDTQRNLEGWEAQLLARGIDLLREVITAAREDAEKDFKDRLQQAARDWARAAQLEHNIETQKTIEALRAGTTAVTHSELGEKIKDLLKLAARHWDRAAQLQRNVETEKTLEQLRAGTTAVTRTELGEKIKGLLRQAARHWDRAGQLAYNVDIQRRIEEIRKEIRQELEKEFQDRLRQAARDWDEAAQRGGEVSFQKRLEQACSEAAAVARRESEIQIEDLREQLEASRKALTLAVSSSQSGPAQSSHFDLLRAAVEEIDAQRTQSETLTSLVRRAAQFAPRVVFFVVKGGEAVGWKASGFVNGLNDETVRALTVPTHQQSLLQEALLSFRTAISRSTSPGENSAVLGLYGSPAPERAIAVPLVVRGKAAAVLYADSGTHPENSIGTAAIELLMRVASMGIELLPARRGFEPPRPNLPASQSGETAAQAAPQPPQPSAFKPQAPVAVPEQRPAVPEPVRRPERESAPPDESAQASPPTMAEFRRITEDLPRPRQIEETLHEAEAQSPRPALIEAEPETPSKEVTQGYISTKPGASEVAESKVQEAKPSVPPPPAAPPVVNDRGSYDEKLASAPTVTLPSPPRTPVTPAEPESVQPQKQVVDESSPALPFTEAQQIKAPPPPEPPRPAQPVGVPAPASETEQRAHNDARRFARLLVSEIKLYNAAKVNEGRRNLDLYNRLKDEIDRSRKVYDKRVSPVVAARFDYFYDELVQTLAEGDPAKLGPGCPGPVVLAS